MTLVRGYLRGWRRQRAEVTVEVGSERRRAWKFLMRLMYSGSDFVRLYDCQDQIAFLDGHVREDTGEIQRLRLPPGRPDRKRRYCSR